MITVSYSVSNLEGERDIEILALDHSSSSHAKKKWKNKEQWSIQGAIIGGNEAWSDDTKTLIRSQT
ncbi:hypothetical protein YC2023_048132 [Brassica napus]